MPFCNSAEVIIATCAPAIMDFRTSWALCTPPVIARLARNPSIENGNPVQPQQQFLRTTQGQAGHDFERFNVEVRLVKAIKKDQSARACRVQLFAHSEEQDRPRGYWHARAPGTEEAGAGIGGGKDLQESNLPRTDGRPPCHFTERHELEARDHSPLSVRVEKSACAD